MIEYKFADYKQKIVTALQERRITFVGEPTGVTLMEGFSHLPITDVLSHESAATGTTVPTVILVGNSTGRLYFVALRHLLPEIKPEVENDGNK